MKLLRLPRTILFGALAFGVLLAIVAVSWSQGQGKAQADAGDSIGVCCAWNSELADGDLTYKISGGDDDAQLVVRLAVEEWEVAVTGLTLTEITDRTKPNIKIKFKRGGGVIAGQALRKFDDGGFIKSVDLTISGSNFGEGNNPDIVGRITKHEIGHALGTGHANFDGDLLSTSVGAGISASSTCDVDTVIAANHWKLVDGDTTPHAPHVTHVHCGPAPTPGPTPTPGALEIVTVDSIGCAVIRNRLIYTITIVDTISEPVEPVQGAIVTGTRLDPRGRLFNFEGETNADGQVSFRASRPTKGDHLITVLDVTGEGIDFGSPVNETCTV